MTSGDSGSRGSGRRPASRLEEPPLAQRWPRTPGVRSPVHFLTVGQPNFFQFARPIAVLADLIAERLEAGVDLSDLLLDFRLNCWGTSESQASIGFRKLVYIMHIGALLGSSEDGS